MTTTTGAEESQETRLQPHPDERSCQGLDSWARKDWCFAPGLAAAITALGAATQAIFGL